MLQEPAKAYDLILSLECLMKGAMHETYSLATNGSRTADRAVKFAAELARATASELTILTVSEWLASDDLEQFGTIESAALGDILENEAKAC